MTLVEEWVVKSDRPIDFSLAGAQTKFPATIEIFIVCGADDIKGCGWKKKGKLVDGYFHVEEHSDEDPDSRPQS